VTFTSFNDYRDEPFPPAKIGRFHPIAENCSPNGQPLNTYDQQPEMSAF